jgi:hypothetical protein
MKKIIITITLITSYFVSAAQASEELKTQMEKLAYMVGNWKGEGAVRMGPGEPKKSTVNEHIEWKLQGTLLYIEGIGNSIDAETNKEIVSHHVVAIISYDVNSKQYKFKSYLVDGKSADAYFKIIADDTYEWGFDVPSGKIRYTITLDKTKSIWNEIGEFSRDGATWMNFFEMHLNKQS